MINNENEIAILAAKNLAWTKEMELEEFLRFCRVPQARLEQELASGELSISTLLDISAALNYPLREILTIGREEKKKLERAERAWLSCPCPFRCRSSAQEFGRNRSL